MPAKTRRTSTPQFGFAGMLVFSLALAGCNEEKQKQAGPPPKQSVDVVTLHAQPVTLTTDLPGRISPFRTAEVRPQVNGVILKRLFTEGDVVQAGQQLYQIDPAPYEASLASAQATLLRAQASVRTAQSMVDRDRPLAEPRLRPAGWVRRSRNSSSHASRRERPPEPTRVATRSFAAAAPARRKR